MVRFLPFVAALVTLGATAGAHVPSSKGEWAVLSVPHAGSSWRSCIILFLTSTRHEPAASVAEGDVAFILSMWIYVYVCVVGYVLGDGAQTVRCLDHGYDQGDCLHWRAWSIEHF